MLAKKDLAAIAISGGLIVSGACGMIHHGEEKALSREELRERKIERIVSNAQIAQEENFENYRYSKLDTIYSSLLDGSEKIEKFNDNFTTYKTNVDTALKEINTYNTKASRANNTEKEKDELEKAEKELLGSNNVEELDNVVSQYLSSDNNVNAENNNLYKKDQKDIKELDKESELEGLRAIGNALLCASGIVTATATFTKIIVTGKEECPEE